MIQDIRHQISKKSSISEMESINMGKMITINGHTDNGNVKMIRSLNYILFNASAIGPEFIMVNGKNHPYLSIVLWINILINRKLIKWITEPKSPDLNLIKQCKGCFWKTNCCSHSFPRSFFELKINDYSCKKTELGTFLIIMCPI